MSAVRNIVVTGLVWLVVIAAAVVLVYIATGISSPSGPLAPPKWDGTYHDGGITAKPSERRRAWKEEAMRKDEGERRKAESNEADGLTPPSAFSP